MGWTDDSSVYPSVPWESFPVSPRGLGFLEHRCCKLLCVGFFHVNVFPFLGLHFVLF